MEPVVEVTMTPCMADGGRHYGEEGAAHERCPAVLGKFRCDCPHHTKRKKRVVRRKRRA